MWLCVGDIAVVDTVDYVYLWVWLHLFVYGLAQVAATPVLFLCSSFAFAFASAHTPTITPLTNIRIVIPNINLQQLPRNNPLTQPIIFVHVTLNINPHPIHTFLALLPSPIILDITRIPTMVISSRYHLHGEVTIIIVLFIYV